jgi:hypothetical protein
MGSRLVCRVIIVHSRDSVGERVLDANGVSVSVGECEIVGDREGFTW